MSCSLGVAKATEDTIKAIGPLFPEQGGVSPEDLIDYYGPATPPLVEDAPPNIVTVDLLHT